jgi:DNA-directed RNA polymerase specialized sigma24 family protein
MVRTGREWYDHIDDLVIEFQEGNNECGHEIIEALNPYLVKFARIMQEGFINLKDKDTRKFISLFIADKETRKKLARYYQSTEVRYEAYKAASLIAQACSCMTQEDVDQELKTILLTLARRWKKTDNRRNFCGYVYNSFRYELYRSLSEITKNPLTYRSVDNIRYNDEENIIYSDIDDVTLDDLIILVCPEDLDNSWVRGLTCSDGFLQLTPLQRFIVREYYINGFTDQMIADKVSMHINTIRINRNKSINILREYYGTEEN